MAIDRYVHDTLTIKQWATEVVSEAYHQLDAAALVRRLPVPEQYSGGTISFPVFEEVEAYNFLDNRKAGKGISFTNTSHGEVLIAMDEFPDLSYAFGAEDIRFGIAHLDEQFWTPAARALARRVNDKALGLRKGAKKFIQIDQDVPSETLVDLKFRLDDAGIDTSNLVAWFDTTFERALRKDETIRNASKSGDGGRLLRENEIGRIAGIGGYGVQSIRDRVSFAYDRTKFGGLIVTTTKGSNNNSNVSLSDAMQNDQWVHGTASYEGITIHVSGAPSHNDKGYAVSHDLLAGGGILNADSGVLIVPPGTTKAQLVAAGYSTELEEITVTSTSFTVGGSRPTYRLPSETDTTITEEHIAGTPVPTGNTGKGQVFQGAGKPVAQVVVKEPNPTTAPASGSGSTGS